MARKLVILVFDRTTNAKVTGQAASLSASVSATGAPGSAVPLIDTTADQIDATRQPGMYTFDVADSKDTPGAIFGCVSSVNNAECIVMPVSPAATENLEIGLRETTIT